MVGATDRAALLALLRTRGSREGWSAITAKIIEAGSATAVGSESDALLPDPDFVSAMEQAQAELAAWEADGLGLMTALDEQYPERLLGIHQAPPFLFYVGHPLRHDPGFSVVGSRKASDRGLGIARSIATALVREGLTVIAGLAEGIDAAAHQAALDAGGRTVAIVGTGIRGSYPAKNKRLQAEIGKRGLVLSQFYPDAPPRPQHFPMRNVTMSGYGLATIVVEATEHSGTRIQARVAVEHGRPVILTDLVVRRTEWGKALVGRPGVHVAENLDEIGEIVRQIADLELSTDDDIPQLTVA